MNTSLFFNYKKSTQIHTVHFLIKRKFRRLISNSSAFSSWLPFSATKASHKSHKMEILIFINWRIVLHLLLSIDYGVISSLTRKSTRASVWSILTVSLNETVMKFSIIRTMRERGKMSMTCSWLLMKRYGRHFRMDKSIEMKSKVISGSCFISSLAFTNSSKLKLSQGMLLTSRMSCNIFERIN